MNKKKEKKPHQQIAVELTKNQKIWDDFVQDKRRMCEIKFAKLRDDEDRFKYEIIIEAGKFLKKLGLVEENKISGELKKGFKGIISKTRIFEVLDKNHREWLDTKYSHKGANQHTVKESVFERENEKETPLTEYQQEYAAEVDKENVRDTAIRTLTEQVTGMTTADQGKIIKETPKHVDWRKTLLDESYDHMFQLATRMSKSEINFTLNEVTTLSRVLDKFRDVLLEQRELRDKKEKMSSV